MPEVPIESVTSEASLVDEEFIPQDDAAEAEMATSAAPESDAGEGDAAAEGDDTPEPDGNTRKSLAQKVRNWLGRAA